MQKLDQVTSYILSFDEDEVNDIIAALMAYEDYDLANEIGAAVNDYADEPEQVENNSTDIASLAFNIDCSELALAADEAERLANALDRYTKLQEMQIGNLKAGCE